jgi:hypothetical protein
MKLRSNRQKNDASTNIAANKKESKKKTQIANHLEEKNSEEADQTLDDIDEDLHNEEFDDYGIKN